MIKNKIKNAKGVSLISLVIATTVLVILANVIIYNAKDNLKVGNLKEMQNDISNLRDKISSYYAENGKIPAKIPYTNIETIKNAGVVSSSVDTGEFLVIDLSALDNLTLNRGQDFEKIKLLGENPSADEVNQYTDLYIINETSHNVFYVEGIKLDNEVFYTDYTSEEIDVDSIDLRYIEGIKIPDGFYYAGGTKTLGSIFIKKIDNTETYKWIPVEEILVDIPEGIEIEQTQKEDFIKSANAYQGYYKKENGNTVIYLEIEKWSPSYDEEGIYKDKNGDTAYIPQGFQVSEVPKQNTIDEGLVVRDSKQNEWVWIEVPKTQTVYSTAGLDIKDFTNEEYEQIEKDLQTYANDYREETTYKDEFYSTDQHGFANSNDYNNHKNSMLKSVYQNGGFYIGRYEAGIETARTESSATLPETPIVIKQGVYPYNFVTCKQAQELSEGLATEGKTTSLMFGIQWDLVLKFMEEKGKLLDGTKVTKTMLKTDSSDWGNYYNVEFYLTRGFYTTDPTTSSSWKTASNVTKSISSSALLSTGATDRNSILNIYDLAGNVHEWTLEYTSVVNSPCVSRGGSYGKEGSNYPARIHSMYSTFDFTSSSGFRPALW